MAMTILVTQEGGTSEVSWARQPHGSYIDGYVLVHEDGTLTVTFRDDNDNPYVFVLAAGETRIYATEDQPPSPNDPVVWEVSGSLDPEALRERAHKEMEIARLMGPSDEAEQAWLDYVTALVSLTDGYLDRAREEV